MVTWTTQEHPCVFLDAQVSPRAQERPRAPRSTRGPPRSTQGGQQPPPIPPRSLPVPRCGARNPPKESPHAKAWRLESPNQTPPKQSRQRETPESLGRAPCRTSRRGVYPKTVPKQSQNNPKTIKTVSKVDPPKSKGCLGVSWVDGPIRKIRPLARESLQGARPNPPNQSPRPRESPKGHAVANHRRSVSPCPPEQGPF